MFMNIIMENVLMNFFFFFQVSGQLFNAARHNTSDAFHFGNIFKIINISFKQFSTSLTL